MLSYEPRVVFSKRRKLVAAGLHRVSVTCAMLGLGPDDITFIYNEKTETPMHFILCATWQHLMTPVICLPLDNLLNMSEVTGCQYMRVLDLSGVNTQMLNL